ncbi:hypothetical protein [Microbacterium sp. MYb66]|uniref:hypothetical protein n=1 Tax=Microbacterium sp. MYb66 TaxID=1848692 RepID=UPI000CFF48CD|nr:hypothetical protein [Microbacterium sp. MYb66]PRA82277.1 hypothetical protein CQ045_06265 [Microbacterium sp. MYb66]
MSEGAVAAATPELRFRLLGAWHPVLLNELDSGQLVADFVEQAFGRRDQDSALRALTRRDLTEAVAQARALHAKAMFLMTELRPGTALPVTLTVFEQPDLRMSPAIGVSPQAVAATLERVFTVLERPHLDTAQRLQIPGSAILRLHSVEEQRMPVTDEELRAAPPELAAEAADARFRRLSADYWYTVPGTKQVLLVNLSTPIGDIPHVLLGFFDSIIEASYFELAGEPVAQDA